MTLEAVLNRAGQMNRAERWTLWSACGTHQRDALPRTETGGAQRPRYCRRCWTAFRGDGVLWNTPCLPGTDFVSGRPSIWTEGISDAGQIQVAVSVFGKSIREHGGPDVRA